MNSDQARSLVEFLEALESATQETGVRMVLVDYPTNLEVDDEVLPLQLLATQGEDDSYYYRLVQR